MVISDFKVFIVFVALSHGSICLLWVGGGVQQANTSCGISTGPASANNNILGDLARCNG